jgi:transcriptional regulator with PAS, ATPase and Fis domain
MHHDGTSASQALSALNSASGTAPAQTHLPFIQAIVAWLADANVMAAIIAPDGAVSFVNQAFQGRFGSGAGIPVLPEELTAALRTVAAPGSRLHALSIDGLDYAYLTIQLPANNNASGSLLLIGDIEAAPWESKRSFQLSERVGLLESILDCSADGLMFVDRDGVITYVNRSYEEFHKIGASLVLGRHVTDIIDNTRMHMVVQTGVPEVDEVHVEGNRRFLVSRMPVYRNGALIGAIGQIVFRNIEQVGELASKVERLKSRFDRMKSGKESEPDTRYSADDIVAESAVSAAIKGTALRVAPTDGTVLLLGESGVGKEVYAHAIHAISLRARGPFVRVNCSAIAEGLFESELFGYTEGAFTGAIRGGKPGKFELADCGTIFLDEIADMPLEAQAKLLRVLQEKEIEKLGAGRQIKVDVRVIAATNQDIEKLVAQGKFRKDLYFRLNVIPLTIPPLRERREDIPVLVSGFWSQLQKEHGASYQVLAPDAVRLLCEYSWPGNVRELRNILERAISIVREDTITAEHLRILLLGDTSQSTSVAAENCNLQTLVQMAERRAIGEALARSNNNRTHAARLLGITRPLLYKKMRLYGM